MYRGLGFFAKVHNSNVIAVNLDHILATARFVLAKDLVCGGAGILCKGIFFANSKKNYLIINPGISIIELFSSRLAAHSKKLSIISFSIPFGLYSFIKVFKHL